MKLLVLAILVFAGSCLWWLDAEHGTGGSRQDVGSTLERGPEGLSLARAYLSEAARRDTALLTRDISPASLPDDGVVFRVQPPGAGSLVEWLKTKRTPSAVTLAQETAWLERGGRLVRAAVGTGDTITAQPAVVLPLLSGVRRLSLSDGRGLADNDLRDATPVVIAGEDVLIAHRRVGKGDLWVLSCPTIFTNAALTQADHAALLLALAGTGRPVWFDEQVHGVVDDGGFVALLRSWGLGPALLLGALLVALWFWRGRTLLGPPADPWRDRRAEAVEGVEALAGLYHRALSRRELIDSYRQRLLREVSLRTGQRPVAARATVDRLTHGLRIPAGTLGEHDFLRLMHQLNQAFRSLRDEHRRRRP